MEIVMDANTRMKMLNLYYRDRVKDLGFSHAKVMQKLWYMFYTMIRPDIFKKMLKILMGKYSYIRQVEIVMTTKCSLKCRDCANLMQYYMNPYDTDFSTISFSINNLLNKIDEIGTVVLVGGEPFLSSNIKEIIDLIAENSKVDHIDIFTNGTILPQNETIISLKKKKVRVIVSDYGVISGKKMELVNICQKNGINVYLKTKDLHWGLVGDMKPRNRSNKALSKQFRNCNNYCRSILNGKLFYCPRAGHGMDLGIIKTHENEYVNLMKEEISSEDILRIVYSKNYFSACDYCNYGTKQMVNICPGVQLSAQEKEELCKNQFNIP